MESKAKKQKSSTGEKIAKAIITLSIVIIIAGVITAIASTIAYGGDESTPLLAKIVIYAGGITMLAWVCYIYSFCYFFRIWRRIGRWGRWLVWLVPQRAKEMMINKKP